MTDIRDKESSLHRLWALMLMLIILAGRAEPGGFVLELLLLAFARKSKTYTFTQVYLRSVF